MVFACASICVLSAVQAKIRLAERQNQVIQSVASGLNDLSTKDRFNAEIKKKNFIATVNAATAWHTGFSSLIGVSQLIYEYVDYPSFYWFDRQQKSILSLCRERSKDLENIMAKDPPIDYDLMQYNLFSKGDSLVLTPSYILLLRPKENELPGAVDQIVLAETCNRSERCLKFYRPDTLRYQGPVFDERGLVELMSKRLRCWIDRDESAQDVPYSVPHGMLLCFDASSDDCLYLYNDGSVQHDHYVYSEDLRRGVKKVEKCHIDHRIYNAVYLPMASHPQLTCYDVDVSKLELLLEPKKGCSNIKSPFYSLRALFSHQVITQYICQGSSRASDPFGSCQQILSGKLFDISCLERLKDKASFCELLLQGSKASTVCKLNDDVYLSRSLSHLEDTTFDQKPPAVVLVDCVAVNTGTRDLAAIRHFSLMKKGDKTLAATYALWTCLARISAFRHNIECIFFHNARYNSFREPAPVHSHYDTGQKIVTEHCKCILFDKIYTNDGTGELSCAVYLHRDLFRAMTWIDDAVSVPAVALGGDSPDRAEEALREADRSDGSDAPRATMDEGSIASIRQLEAAIKVLRASLLTMQSAAISDKSIIEQQKRWLSQVQEKLVSAEAAVKQKEKSEIAVERMVAVLGKQYKTNIERLQQELSGKDSDLTAQKAKCLSLTHDLEQQKELLRQAQEQMVSAKVAVKQSERMVGQLTQQVAQLEAEKSKTAELLRQAQDKLSTEKSSHQAALERLTKQLTEKDSDLTAQKARCLSLANDLEGQKELLRQAQEQMVSAKAAVKQSERMVGQLTQQVAQLEVEKSKTAEQLKQAQDKLSTEKSSHQAALERLTKQLTEKDSDLMAQKARCLSLANDLEGQKELLRQAQDKLSTEKSSHQAALERLTKQLTEKDSDLTAQKARCLSLTNDLEQQKERLSQVREELVSAKGAVKQSEIIMVGQLTQQVAQLEAEKSKTAEQLRQAQDKLSTEKSSHQAALECLTKQLTEKDSGLTAQTAICSSLSKSLKQAEATQQKFLQSRNMMIRLMPLSVFAYGVGAYAIWRKHSLLGLFSFICAGGLHGYGAYRVLKIRS